MVEEEEAQWDCLCQPEYFAAAEEAHMCRQWAHFQVEPADRLNISIGSDRPSHIERTGPWRQQRDMDMK